MNILDLIHHLRDQPHNVQGTGYGQVPQAPAPSVQSTNPIRLQGSGGFQMAPNATLNVPQYKWMNQQEETVGPNRDINYPVVPQYNPNGIPTWTTGLGQPRRLPPKVLPHLIDPNFPILSLISPMGGR